MKEIWKDIYFIDENKIYDYTGLYQVSNLGRVKSFSRKGTRTKEERILKTSKIAGGYLQVGLYKHGKVKKFLVHRLVALLFVPNTANKVEINHEDGNKQNCCASNLSWVTRKENINHAIKTGLIKYTNRTNKRRNRRQILQFDLEGNFIKEWDGVEEIVKEFNVAKQCIYVCCQNKIKTSKGFIWKYKNIE